MSSRAVRKTAGHTTQDDLAQVLQKVGISKYDDESDSIIPSGQDQRRNVFQMLADDDDHDDHTNDDQDEKVAGESDGALHAGESQAASTTSKAKRKRKIKKKGGSTQKTDQVMGRMLSYNMVTVSPLDRRRVSHRSQ